jgi:ligand-binding sensor domain-containing protein/signal transduction histidine kinase
MIGAVLREMLRRVAILFAVLAAGCGCAFALKPSLDISQYAHNSWTTRGGFSLGNVYAMAQTADGYLWLGSEFGLFRFDGVRILPWQPPAGQRLTTTPFSMLVTRDGTLWIGTFDGLATWDGARLARRPEFEGKFVWSLLEDREGTVWVGLFSPAGRICAMRPSGTQCYGDDHIFGKFVTALLDGAGNLWAGAQSGLWRWKPGPPRRYAMPPVQLTGLTAADDGGLLVAAYGQTIKHLSGEKVESYPVRDAVRPNNVLPDRDVNSNRLLRDRDGGLWIGTVERGLIHVHQGRTDFFRRSDGLSGDVILDLFEDREGDVWVATTGGLDCFRELPVTTISVKHGLSSDATNSVLAGGDGSVWIASHDGLTRWKDGQTTILRKSSGLPDDVTHSLFQDDGGRIWVSTDRGLAYVQDGRLAAVNGVPDGEVYCITGDKGGSLWLSEMGGLLHWRDGRLVDQIPWPEMGRHQQAKVLLPDSVRGGMWLGFWSDGGVLYLQDRQLRATYGAVNGLGAGPVSDVRLESDGALWVATEEGGISRLKDGGIATLTTRNGLHCNAIHWTIRDDDRSLWAYTACGVVRITRGELDAWVADPKHRVETTVWDAGDGVRLRAVSATGYRPPVTKSTDGRLWFVTGEGVQVLDPRHLAVNQLPPPVHIERVTANGEPYPLKQGMRLPANVRDLWIDYTALSLAAPEKVHFKYMLEGQDLDWKEVINDRQAQYSNLRPRKYRFHVIASNNSGVWNTAGDMLEFSVAPAFYQTAWFGGACAAAFLGLLWALYRLRLERLAREFNARVEERTRIARDLHDTLLQSFQGLMFSFQAARNLLPGRVDDAIRTLDRAIGEGDGAIAEGRDAIQGLRADPALERNLEHLLSAAGKEFARSSGGQGEMPAFQVSVEGTPQALSPLLQDDIYRIAREILRNAFYHARATRIEAEIAYDRQFFRLRIRDNHSGRGAPGALGIARRPRARQIHRRRVETLERTWRRHGSGADPSRPNCLQNRTPPRQ